LEEGRRNKQFAIFSKIFSPNEANEICPRKRNLTENVHAAVFVERLIIKHVYQSD
jgi:hypothetical protein